jgi:hypothetical protein
MAANSNGKLKYIGNFKWTSYEGKKYEVGGWLNTGGYEFALYMTRDITTVQKVTELEVGYSPLYNER